MKLGEISSEYSSVRNIIHVLVGFFSQHFNIITVKTHIQNELSQLNFIYKMNYFIRGDGGGGRFVILISIISLI